jgi:hypothetical protein
MRRSYIHERSFDNRMSLKIPGITRAVLDPLESSPATAIEYEFSGKLSGLHGTAGLDENERKGSWAEAAAFNFVPAKESPWGTNYGPVVVAAQPDGTPYYAPDINGD